MNVLIKEVRKTNMRTGKTDHAIILLEYGKDLSSLQAIRGIDFKEELSNSIHGTHDMVEINLLPTVHKGRVILWYSPHVNINGWPYTKTIVWTIYDILDLFRNKTNLLYLGGIEDARTI